MLYHKLLVHALGYEDFLLNLVKEGCVVTTTQSCEMVFGTINVVNGIVTAQSGHRFAYFEVDDVLPVSGQNTVLVDQVVLASSRKFRIEDYDGTSVETGETTLKQAFICFNAAPNLQRYLNVADALLAPAASVVPLFLITERIGSITFPDGDHVTLVLEREYHSQLRMDDRSIIFIRTGSETSIYRKISALERYAQNEAVIKTSLLDMVEVGIHPLDRPLELHAASVLFLSNHQCYYRKLNPGFEIEYKLNLSCPDKIWPLATKIYDDIAAGNLPGYILEYRDDFQKWDYMNHIFEVTAPEEERGYISFIPQTNGCYTVKRKIFATDQLMRREILRPNQTISGDIEEHLRSEYSFETRKLPPFRRVRYDINFESLQTGNVFGIFFDCVSASNYGARLIQCEIEYLRTRSISENEMVNAELDHIFGWVCDSLAGMGIAFEKTFMSKLTFVRALVADAALNVAVD